MAEVKSVTGIFGPLPFTHDGETLRVELGLVRWLPIVRAFGPGLDEATRRPGHRHPAPGGRRRDLAAGGGYTPSPTEDKPQWGDYFRARLGSITTTTRFAQVDLPLISRGSRPMWPSVVTSGVDPAGSWRV
jgi:hypothetical protein